MATPTIGPDYREEAHRRALEDGSGVSPLVASMAIGETPQFPPTAEFPPVPRPPFKPVPTGHVRGEPGTPSGRDLAREITERSETDPAAVPLTPELRRQYFSKKNAPVIRSDILAASKDLREFYADTHLSFPALSRDEMASARRVSKAGSGSNSVRSLFHIVQGNRQGVSEETWINKRKSADDAVTSELNKWGDFLQDSHEKTDLLKRLQQVVAQGTTAKNASDVLLAAVQTSEDYTKTFTAVKALVQYLDLKALAHRALPDVPFDPLRGHTDRHHPNRESAHKRLQDAYNSPHNIKKGVGYILARAKLLDVDTIKMEIKAALEVHADRAKFWGDNLLTVQQDTAYRALGGNVFMALNIGAPE